MEVKILEKHNNCLQLFVRGIGIAVANSLRRIMIAEVPSLAIEDVVIVENSSSMADEILAHRLGLIPLKTDLESYVLRENCDCDNELGCTKCNVIITLEAEATDSPRTVYSKELRSSDPDITPVSGDVPILKIAPNQKIRLEAYAKLGRGSEHAKWQPVSVCTVRPVSIITIDAQNCDACKKCIEICPKQVLRIDNDKVEIVDYEKCNDCKQCKESCPQNVITIENSKTAFVFNIESTGTLLPEYIFDSAIDILKEKAQEFITEVSNLKSKEEE